MDRVPWERNIRRPNEDPTDLVVPEKAIKLICDLVDELEARGVKYWFNWGLLLGAVRQNDFIPYDTDLDITVHWEDRDKIYEIEPIMESKGCYVPTREECFYEDRWFIRDREKIELNFVERVGDKYIYSPNRCNLGCPVEYIDKLDAITFYGREFTIPSNAKEYLRLSYGDNWGTPIVGKKPRTL
jgi:lipopolysaccharide cholinephosphotransferase